MDEQKKQLLNINANSSDVKTGAECFVTYMFVEECSNSRKFWVETVPHNHLQPANLDFSIQTIKQRRVTPRESRHHVWWTNRQTDWWRTAWHSCHYSNSEKSGTSVGSYHERVGTDLACGRGTWQSGMCSMPTGQIWTQQISQGHLCAATAHTVPPQAGSERHLLTDPAHT